MRKLSSVLAVAVACLSCFVASAGAKPAPTTLTIQSSPGGVFGYVNSPAAKACAAKRKVDGRARETVGERLRKVDHRQQEH